MRAWSSARYTVPLPDGHRFPIAKYARIRDEIVARGVLAAGAIVEPDRADRWALELVHTPRYADAVLAGTLTPAEVRRLGFPWSPDLRERSLRTVQGTLEAARDALEIGLGINLAGGTHHAFADHGEGFCVFNDVAIAIRVLQREGRLGRVAIIDLDVHQGNGTARIFADDPDVFTFSMHGARNYPFRKERSALDVELEDGCQDAAYLAALDTHLGPALDAARAELVFYLGGADPYAHDRFGRLGLTVAGLLERDRRAFDAFRRRGLPAVVTMAGGYARELEDVVTIQANMVEAALVAYA
ncbi:MAG TPA: histone deacetylase [Gemmatimonadales bacterium]|nr:histone deacetylase [Gemmatimonadales bacterium]